MNGETKTPETGSSPLARGTQFLSIEECARERFIPARAGNTAEGAARGIHQSVHPRSRGEHSIRDFDLALSSGSSPLARGTQRRRKRRRGRGRFIPARAGNTHGLEVPRPGPAVHPRSRGEHSPSAAVSACSTGSSPLARGTPTASKCRGRVLRFIPARAGNTGSMATSTATASVHPRSRGEHLLGHYVVRQRGGSSPLARGTRMHRLQTARACRFIPARAGNTSMACAWSIVPAVHPRSRGEHRSRARAAGCRNGSSPLARGTLEPRAHQGSRDRFIPARAGNTDSAASPSALKAVHPRSRGEHFIKSQEIQKIHGSSPLARGTLVLRRAGSSRNRFIPARAGNTRGNTPWRTAGAVHPRSRGEHSPPAPGRLPAPGSSPLARGTRGGGVQPGRRRRFIPARAGNTTRWRTTSCWMSVHPRSRGEHMAIIDPLCRLTGSSPLARGTRRARHSRRGRGRFIPARAGNTDHPSPSPSPASGSSPLARGTPPTSTTSRASPPVHPRSRGEHPPPYHHHGSASGSSPLARGTREATGGEEEGGRFIPARAGNTIGAIARRPPRPVHPRSRGEHWRCRGAERSRSGSSPLARGTRTTGRTSASRVRFIPARAGNTVLESAVLNTASVHPRSRGEHSFSLVRMDPPPGSSPLARGTHSILETSDITRRFIPARAGNTPPERTFPSSSNGSSPLARGTQLGPRSGRYHLRFIPARAGNTWSRCHMWRTVPVHPRSRGEHIPSAVRLA